MALLVLFLTLAIGFSRADLQEKRESRYGDGGGGGGKHSMYFLSDLQVLVAEFSADGNNFVFKKLFCCF